MVAYVAVAIGVEQFGCQSAEPQALPKLGFPDAEAGGYRLDRLAPSINAAIATNSSAGERAARMRFSISEVSTPPRAPRPGTEPGNRRG